jgi:hypothetical protein
LKIDKSYNHQKLDIDQIYWCSVTIPIFQCNINSLQGFDCNREISAKMLRRSSFLTDCCQPAVGQGGAMAQAIVAPNNFCGGVRRKPRWGLGEGKNQ